MRKGNCEQCGKEFVAKLESKRFCSKSCGARNRTLRVNPMQHQNKMCVRCGKEYRGTSSSKYCSKECLNNNHKKCGHCGKIFTGHYNARYCSMKCKDAFKVRKDTGERENCIVCGTEYAITHGKKKLVNSVCSVKCSNAINSKLGKYLDVEMVEDLVRKTPYQMSAEMIADKLNTTSSTVHSRATEKYGSYKNMVITLKGRYVNTNDSQSATANSLFYMIEDLYGIKGNFEKEFDDLINPLTKVKLRIDFYVENLPLAIEYHGRQHFEKVEFFDKHNSFKARKTRDYIKEKYLKDRGIPLVIFSCFDDLTEEIVRKKLNKYFNK